MTLFTTRVLYGSEAFQKFLGIVGRRKADILWFKVGEFRFFEGRVEDGNLKTLYATKGSRENRTRSYQLRDPYKNLRFLCEKYGKGAFFHPGKPGEKPLDDYITETDLVSTEMDSGTTDEQRARLERFSECTGLIPGLIIGSGSKSLHGHIVLEEPIAIAKRTSLSRHLALLMLGDPEVIKPNQPMRVPGFPRPEKGKEQQLEFWSENRYTFDQVLDGFRKYYEIEGYQFHQEFSEERWGKLRRVIANQKTKDYDPLTPDEQKAEIREILALSEEELKPKWKPPSINFNLNFVGESNGTLPPTSHSSTQGYTPQQTINISYERGVIPIEHFLPRRWQEYVKSGIGAAGEGRNPTALKIVSLLIGTEEILNRWGVKYSGSSYQLLSDFCNRCSPPITEQIDSIYRNAQKGYRKIRIDENDIKVKIYYFQKGNNPNFISKEEWIERFKISKNEAELAQILQRFCSRFKRKTKTVEPTTKVEPTKQTVAPVTVNSSAIVLWKPPTLISLPYVPGQLPSVEEWQQMGCPKIIFKKGERLQLFAEARELGYKFTLDSTPPGHGKSFDAGLNKLETFGIDPNDKENKTRIFYLSPDHRNPTNATVEANYVDLEARHPGLNYDHTRKTTTGNPYVVRAKKNQNPDIPSNCPENQTFLTVAELGLPVFGGKDSAICQSCPLLEQGCSFLFNRAETLTRGHLIRADINSMPNPSSSDILMLDDSSIVNANKFTVSNDELLKTVGNLQLRDERIFKALRPVLVTVYKALQSVTTEKHKYGIPHRKVMELLPSIDELNQLIWDLYADDWLKADNPFGYPIWHYEMVNGVPEATKVIGEDFVAPSLNDLAKECYKILGNYANHISGIQTPQEKQEAIKTNVVPPWLPALIDCLTGNKRINLRIDNGKLIITKLAKRHRNIIKNAGFSIVLDATQSKQDLALSLGVSPDEILEVSEVKRPTPNFHLHIIKGMGSCSKQRRDTMQDRIAIFSNAIAQRHKGQNLGLIDHKSAIDNYQNLAASLAESLKLGYWHRDNRGSNQFLDTQVLISVGRPCPNLGQMAAEYQALTGYSPTPDQLTGRYGQWVKRKITSELIQCSGRPRAHLRPDEQLHHYIVADLDDDTISALRFAYPTAIVTVEDVYDIAPEAASKGTQTERGIVNAVWDFVKAGVQPAIEKVAEALGITKGGVSKCLKDRQNIGFRFLVKSLLLLFEAINNKSKLSDLPDDARWIAEEYLPNLVADFERGDMTSADLVVEIITTAKASGERDFRQILAATPIPILCKLIGALVQFLPQKILAEIIPPSPPIKTA